MKSNTINLCTDMRTAHVHYHKILRDIQRSFAPSYHSVFTKIGWQNQSSILVTWLVWLSMSMSMRKQRKSLEWSSSHSWIIETCQFSPFDVICWVCSSKVHLPTGLSTSHHPSVAESHSHPFLNSFRKGDEKTFAHSLLSTWIGLWSKEIEKIPIQQDFRTQTQKTKTKIGSYRLK